jgi:hypothetical protein
LGFWFESASKPDQTEANSDTDQASDEPSGIEFCPKRSPDEEYSEKQNNGRGDIGNDSSYSHKNLFLLLLVYTAIQGVSSDF